MRSVRQVKASVSVFGAMTPGQRAIKGFAMSTFPDMCFITSPITTGLVVVEVIGHRTIVTLDAITGKCAVITRDEDERVLCFACTF